MGSHLSTFSVSDTELRDVLSLVGVACCHEKNEFNISNMHVQVCKEVHQGSEVGFPEL